MTLPNSTIQWCTKMSSDEFCKKVNLFRGAFLYSYKCRSMTRFFIIFLTYIVHSKKLVLPLSIISWRICFMFDMLYYRVYIKRKMAKYSIDSFFVLFDNWYFSHTILEKKIARYVYPCKTTKKCAILKNYESFKN